jgi:hypothetical protein
MRKHGRSTSGAEKLELLGFSQARSAPLVAPAIFLAD